MPMILRLAKPLRGDGMSVVKADQSLTARPVQRERIVETMGFFRGSLHTRHHEFDPIITLWIHDQHLAVEIEQHIEGWIARKLHAI
jgi:hypothetical protein